MKALEFYIDNLLHKHDCVIVPGFGGFVANAVGAKLLPKQNIILPPSRQLTFNRNLTLNDGLLANCIARLEQMDYEQASLELEAAVKLYTTQLSETRRLELEKIGLLYVDSSNKILFQPKETNDYFAEAFGLGKCFVQPLQTEEKPVEVVKPTPVIPFVTAADENKPEKKQEERKKSKLGWIAAAIAIPLLLMGGYVIKTQQNAGENNISIAGWNPFSPHAKAPTKEDAQEAVAHFEDKSKASNTPDQNTDAFENAVANLDENKVPSAAEGAAQSDTEISLPKSTEESEALIAEALAKVNASKPNKAEPEEAKSTGPQYYIVGGAFGELANAESFVKGLQAKGYDATVFGKRKGLHMVCYSAHATRSAARAALAEVKIKANKSAWLLKY